MPGFHGSNVRKTRSIVSPVRDRLVNCNKNSEVLWIRCCPAVQQWADIRAPSLKYAGRNPSLSHFRHRSNVQKPMLTLKHLFILMYRRGLTFRVDISLSVELVKTTKMNPFEGQLSDDEACSEKQSQDGRK